jgi:hypothetical protein
LRIELGASIDLDRRGFNATLPQLDVLFDQSSRVAISNLFQIAILTDSDFVWRSMQPLLYLVYSSFVSASPS